MCWHLPRWSWAPWESGVKVSCSYFQKHLGVGHPNLWQEFLHCGWAQAHHISLCLRIPTSSIFGWSLGWDREFHKERKKTRRGQDLGWVDRWNKSRSVIQGVINKDMPLLLSLLLLLLVVLWSINLESFLFSNELIFRDFIFLLSCFRAAKSCVSNTVSGLDCGTREKRSCSQRITSGISHP